MSQKTTAEDERYADYVNPPNRHTRGDAQCHPQSQDYCFASAKDYRKEIGAMDDSNVNAFFERTPSDQVTAHRWYVPSQTRMDAHKPKDSMEIDLFAHGKAQVHDMLKPVQENTRMRT